MALSPWKRLTRLMLRRRPADQVQARLSDDRNASDDVVDTPDVAFAYPEVEGGAASELEPIAALADELLQASDAEEAKAVETAAEFEVASEPQREDGPPAAQEGPPTGQPVQQPSEGQAKKTRRSWRRPTHAVPPVEAEQDQILNSIDMRSSSSDLRVLDGEIRQLREQLSAKLRTQNTQLKQMLKRFELR